jgi:hypothetical protein
VAHCAASLVDVDTQHAGEEIFVDALAVAQLTPGAAFIPHGEVQEAVAGMEEEPAALMPDAFVLLIDEH